MNAVIIAEISIITTISTASIFVLLKELFIEKFFL